MRHTLSILATSAAAIALVGHAVAATFGVAQPDTEMQRRLAAVCAADSGYILTLEAHNACVSQAFPALNSDGKGFRNSGIGAEFNTLMRQVPAQTAAAQ